VAVVVPIVSEWNPKGVDRAMADIKKAEGKMGKLKAGLGKAFLPATAALAGLGAAAWDASKSAEELVSSQAALNQVFSQMGNADAADRVKSLADELERTLGIDEKLIMQVQTTLGTFGELAASADEAGGAFDRTTMAALDLAAAGFGTAESNAVQLGKALNDPVKGLSALAKSGVTFTDAEKDKIKVLVESGKQLEAQEMILAAIEKQVGGTAEATADSSAKMSLGFADLKETLGLALLPAFDALNGYLAGFASWAGKNSKLILVLAGVIGGLAAAIVAANIAIKAYVAITAIIKAATVAWTVAQGALNVALLANPIGLVVVAIVALIGIVVLAYNKVDWFRDLVDTAFAAVKDAIKAVVDWFRDTAWPILKKVFALVGDAVQVYVGAWIAVFRTVWDVMKTVFGWLSETFSPVLSSMWDDLQAGLEVLRTVWETVFGAMSRAVQAAWNIIRPLIDQITRAIDGLKSAWDAAKSIGSAVSGALPFSAEPTMAVATGGAARSSSVVNVNVTAGIGDPVKIAAEIERVLRARDRRIGTR
jgi:hypothetical protein